MFAIILVDLDSTFVTRVAALKFVDFRQVGVIIVPGLYNLIQWHLLVYQGHIVRRWYDVFVQLSSSHQA
jgi:hypothetical protein